MSKCYILSMTDLGSVFICRDCKSKFYFNDSNDFLLGCPICHGTHLDSPYELANCNCNLLDYFTLAAISEQPQYYVLRFSSSKIHAKNFQMVACRWFSVQGCEVNSGDLGGIVSGYHNVAQDGSWIDSSSKVMDYSYIHAKTLVRNHSVVRDCSYVNHSIINGHSMVSRNSFVMNTNINDGQIVSNMSEICGSRRNHI